MRVRCYFHRVILAGCLFLSVQQALPASDDITPPTGSIVINDNRSATKSSSVTLKLQWSDGDGSGVSRMRFSNDGSTWSAWTALSTPVSYSLPVGDGHKTVRVQFIDRSNNRSLVYSDYIRFDSMPPTGSVIINDGNATTSRRLVTLKMNWSDGQGSGVSRMRFSDNGSNWTPWLPLSNSRKHTLPEGLGYHTVRVQYTDGAGNYSVVEKDYIKLIEPMPGELEMITIPGGGPAIEMIWIPSGSFTMGSPTTEQQRHADESPQHQVILSGFWMGKYEITKSQWAAVMQTIPWNSVQHGGTDPSGPIVNVSWNDAQSFTQALNAHIIASQQGPDTVKLPSESQWEYSCRAGTETAFYWGEDTQYTILLNYVWCWQNTIQINQYYPHNVGQKIPNNYGLYDMSGNVAEWCRDRYNSHYNGAPNDGSAWETPVNANRILRGGNFTNSSSEFRSAERKECSPTIKGYTIGFRVSRSF